MINEIQILKQQMLDNLKRIEPQERKVEMFASSAKEIFEKLRTIVTFITSYTFLNKEEEVLFFKEEFPFFYSLYLYFSRALDAEVKRKSKISDSLKPDLKDENKDVELFFEDNKAFLKYYFSGETTMDERLYTRNGITLWPFDNPQPVIDSIIPTASIKVSWLKAYDLYAAYLRRELFHVSTANNNPDIETSDDIDKVEFKGSKSFVVEGIVGLAESGLVWINGKKATIVDLTERVAKALNLDLKDISHIDYANRIRKKEQTPFMNSLIEFYLRRADRLNK